jgi:hypothetical protein
MAVRDVKELTVYIRTYRVAMDFFGGNFDRKLSKPGRLG